MTRTEMIEQATVAKAATCADCGTNVLAFRVHAGFHTQLEDHDLPISVDVTHPGVRHRLWQHLGPNLGWAPQFSATRTWRPLRVEHRCAVQQQNENKENR